MNFSNEQKALILHTYLSDKKSTVQSVSEALNIETVLVKKVLREYIENLNISYEEIQ